MIVYNTQLKCIVFYLPIKHTKYHMHTKDLSLLLRFFFLPNKIKRKKIYNYLLGRK